LKKLNTTCTYLILGLFTANTEKINCNIFGKWI
jgi:hypothetical protein